MFSSGYSGFAAECVSDGICIPLLQTVNYIRDGIWWEQERINVYGRDLSGKTY